MTFNLGGAMKDSLKKETSVAVWPDNVDVFSEIRDSLPTVFTRQQAAASTHGLLTVYSLTNLDSLRQGPARRRIGRRVFYERESFMDWLEKRYSTMKSNNFFSKAG